MTLETLRREKPMRNNACILAEDYRGPRGWVDKKFQPRSSDDSWIFDWRWGRTIALLRRITCLKEGRTKWSFSIKLNASKLNLKLPSMMQTQIWATNVRWGGRTLSHVNSEYNYSQQLALNTIIANKSVMTKFGWMEEDFVMQEITNNKSILQKTWVLTCLASLALGS